DVESGAGPPRMRVHPRLRHGGSGYRSVPQASTGSADADGASVVATGPSASISREASSEPTIAMTPPANEITRPVCVAASKFDVGTPTASATRPKPTRDITRRNADEIAI